MTISWLIQTNEHRHSDHVTLSPRVLTMQCRVTLSWEQVKERMIKDTILLVDPLPFDRDALFQVLQRRLTKTTQGTNIPRVLKK